MPPILEVKQVSKTHEKSTHPAVQSVSFTLEEGQILSLTGESGSGKTTLLKLTAGLLEADAGQVFLDGEWVKGPSRRLVPGHPDIKMVYQHYELSPNLNARQNIAHILRAYEDAYREERTEELLALCKLSTLANRYPRELSGGEKQRLALARAIAEEPRLLLMDEPFSNIDVGLKNHLKHEITEILEDLQITTIMVTHDPQDALSMASRVAVMQQGSMLQIDAPQQIYRYPASAYVARLFGPCNFIDRQTARKLFNWRGKEQICLRAEDIKMGEPEQDGPKALVKKIRYMGAYQEVSVEVEQQYLRLHHQENHVKVGDKVSLLVAPEKMIRLKEGNPG